MAAWLGTATSFKISRSLFRNDDGSPISFYSDYASDDLRNIIHKGGGYMVEDPAEATILLCEKKTDNRISGGHLPLDFIVDCVKRNSFLNVDSYRSENLGLRASTSGCKSVTTDTDDGDEENLVKISGSSRMSVRAAGLLGRKKYSDLEDMKIIKYLINHEKYSEIGGNIVWKQMELVKVTDHSYQSMKARFQKKILPEIDTYDIPDDWKAKLCGQCNKGIPKFSAESNGDVSSFDEIEKWKNGTKVCHDTRFKKSSEKGVVNSTSDNLPSTENVTILRTEPESTSQITSPINEQSPTVSKSTATELDPERSSSGRLRSIQEQRLQTNKCAHIPCHVNDDTSLNQGASSQEAITTAQSSYVYDELDHLIISEANKSKNLEEENKKRAQSNSGGAVVTRKRAKEVKNNTSDEGSPRKIRNISSRVCDIKSGEVGKKSFSVAESCTRTTADSSVCEGSVKVSPSPKRRQQVCPDDQVDEAAKHGKSGNRKLRDAKEVLSVSDTKKRPLRSNGSVSVIESSDAQNGHESSKTKRVATRSSDAGSTSSDELLKARSKKRKHDEDVSNKESLNSVQTVQSRSSVRSQRDATSKPHLSSFDQVEEESPDQQIKAVHNILQSKAKLSSKRGEKSTELTDSSSSGNSSEHDSPKKATYMNTIRLILKGHKDVCVSSDAEFTNVQHSEVRHGNANTRLSSEDRETRSTRAEPKQVVSKESTLRRVKFLSKEYGLSMEDAAHLLWKYKCNFASLICYMES